MVCKSVPSIFAPLPSQNFKRKNRSPFHAWVQAESCICLSRCFLFAREISNECRSTVCKSEHDVSLLKCWLDDRGSKEGGRGELFLFVSWVGFASLLIGIIKMPSWFEESQVDLLSSEFRQLVHYRCGFSISSLKENKLFKVSKHSSNVFYTQISKRNIFFD